MRRLLLALLLLASLPLSAQSFRVVGVIDGDTLDVLDASKHTLRIRLQGIDAPEKSQPFGRVSKSNLAALVYGREVVVRGQKIDRYGRLVAAVSVDGRDAGLDQLQRGLAWVYADYEKEIPAALHDRYLAAQQAARSARIGLWSEPSPQPPWVYRRARRN